MDRRKDIFKNTFKFFGSFIIMNILFVIIFGISIMYTPTGKPLNIYVPVSKRVEPENLNWPAIGDIGGRGVVIDHNGDVINSYVEKDEKESYTKMELLDLFDIRGRNETIFPYDTKDNNKLLIIYPKSVFTAIPSLNVNTVMGHASSRFSIVFVLGLIVYIFLIYRIVAKLSRRLKTEFDLIKAEEDEKENLLFRGLAHDIKTPLSVMIAYSKSLEDGIVDEEEIENYHKSIYNNGIMLKERVDDMLRFSTLGDEGIFSPKKDDILETVRRFIGDNYQWFTENNAAINIGFHDKEKFIIDYDEKLVKRLLENLLQNSVHHNSNNINISTDWDSKNNILSIYDDGIGIPDNIKDNMWEPMVIGDESRTGEKLRGMGLANVKRIVELHGWDIEYDGKFKIGLR